MKKLSRSIIMILAATSLTGCFGDKSVEKVKGLTYDSIDNTNTLGNALDTRLMCASANWDAGEDNRKRKVVNYRCELTGFDVYFSKWNDENVNNISAKAFQILDKKKNRYELEIENSKTAEGVKEITRKLESEHVFKTLSIVKRKNKRIVDVIAFATQDDIESQFPRLNLSDEEKKEFLKASKVLNTLIYDGEYTAEIMSGSYANSYDDIVNSIIAGKSEEEAVQEHIDLYQHSKEYLEKVKQEYEEVLANTETDKLEILRSQWEKNQPVKIVQHIVYATETTSPVLLSCEFEFYTPNSKDKIAYKKTIKDAGTCLQQSYQSEYNKFYTDMFAKVYTEQSARK